MTRVSKFAHVALVCGALGLALPMQANAFWGHHRRATTAYAPVAVASPVVVARPVFAAPVVVARPVFSAPVVVGYAPTATFAAPTTTFYAPTTTWGAPAATTWSAPAATTAFYAPSGPVMVAPAAVPTTTFFAPAPVVRTRRVIVNSPVIVVP